MYKDKKGILIVWVIPASLQAWFKSKTEYTTLVKIQKKVLISGVLTITYLSKSASTQHQPHQSCQQAAWPGKGLPLPPPECTAAAPATSTPGCREALSSSAPLLSRPWSTVFMAQHIWEITGRVQHPAIPQLTQDQLGAVWWTGELLIPRLWEGTHHTTTHTYPLTAQPGSRTKPQRPQLGQTPPKPPNLVPDIGHVCKWPASPPKEKAWNKFLSKRTHERLPWAVLHLCSIPVYHLWHKVMKGDLSWAEPVVSSLPCCSTEVENMY